MKLDWNVVNAGHITKACELTVSGQFPARLKAKGIVVLFQDHELPAKHVLKLAYCLAKDMPLSSEVKFASGDGTVSLLQRRGFNARRRQVASAI